MTRTLCLKERDLPVFSLSLLEETGWEISSELPNGEIVCYKDNLIGFLNNRTGHFVSCKKTQKLQIMIEETLEKQKIKRHKKEVEYYLSIGYIYGFGAWRPSNMYVGCLE